MIMNTTLLLVRHAQTTSNTNGRYMGWIDEGLTDEGVRQAERISARLSHRPIAAVFSSPLKRALRTAEMIARPHNLPVETLEELGEIRMGDWEGLFAHEIATRYPGLWQTWRSDPSTIQMPGGESLAEVQQRAIQAFDRILRHNQGRQVVAVTHDVIARILVAHCLNVRISIYRRLEVANASLTLIEASNDTYRLRFLNDTTHLHYNLSADEQA